MNNTEETRNWVEAEGGYQLALDEGKLVCRNAKGKLLATVPRNVRDSDTGQSLLGLSDFLNNHALDCRLNVETWMLRSLPVPSRVLVSIVADEAWRLPLTNLLMAPADEAGAWDPRQLGFFRTATPGRGVGLVDLDGETAWFEAPRMIIPHPMLIPNLSDYIQVSGEFGLTQDISQLFREVHPRPATLPADTTELDTWAGAEFDSLRKVLELCRKNGLRVTGGAAVTRVFENAGFLEARFFVGDEDPEYETTTGELYWVRENGQPVQLSEIGPVAWSEGVRMAKLIHAHRNPEDAEDDND